MNPGAALASTLRGGNPGPRRPRRRSTAGRVFRGILVAFLLFLVAGMSARPVYRQIKGLRARWQAGEVAGLVASQRWTEAAQRVRTAVRLAPDDPEVLKVTARFLGTVGSQEAVSYWQRYLSVSGNQVLPGERREYAEAALKANRLDLSRPVLSDLLRSNPTSPDLLSLLVQQHRLMNDLPRATATARLLVSKDPVNRRYQLILGSVLLENPSPALRQEGRRLVWALVVDPGESTATAAALLAELPDLGNSEAEAVLRQLSAETNAPLSSRLVLASVKLRFGAESPVAVIDQILKEVVAGEDWASTAAVSEWLLRHEPKRLPVWLPSELARTNRPFQILRAEGLAAAGQWPELKSVVDDPGSGLTTGLRHYFRGRMAMENGRATEAESEYHSAIEAAGQERRWMPRLGRLAEEQGFPLVALQAWERAVEDPRQAVEAARHISRLARPLDDLTTLRRSVRKLAQFFSSDDSFAAESAILDLLFNEDIPRATATLERVVASQPNHAEWRAGLALARLRAGDPAAGLTLLEESSLGVETASPRSRAIHVALLGSSGQRESARRLVRRIPSEKLRLQERRLIEPWL